MIPIPLSVFRLVQAFGAGKSFIYMIIKLNNCVFFSLTKIFTLQWTLVKQYGCINLVHFVKNRVICWSAGPKI